MNETTFLCRGKRIDSGEWVYGYYVKSTLHWHKHGIHEDWIITSAISNGGYFNVVGKRAVDKKTLGRFTGKYAKNGAPIFSGDIVEIICEGANAVSDPIFAVEYEINGDSACGYGLYDCFDYAVIGNVFDNPHLLEEILKNLEY